MLTKNITKILDKNEVNSQKIIFAELERIARKEGFGHCFDEWTHDLDFMKNYKA